MARSRARHPAGGGLARPGLVPRSPGLVRGILRDPEERLLRQAPHEGRGCARALKARPAIRRRKRRSAGPGTKSAARGATSDLWLRWSGPPFPSFAHPPEARGTTRPALPSPSSRDARRRPKPRTRTGRENGGACLLSPHAGRGRARVSGPGEGAYPDEVPSRDAPLRSARLAPSGARPSPGTQGEEVRHNGDDA
jgi:hypothetical protein